MAIVKEFPVNHLKSISSEVNKTVVESLAQQWAKKYIGNLAEAYLSKPIVQEQLLATLNQLIAQKL